VARLQRRRFDKSDDVRTTPHSVVKMVELGDRIVAHMTFEPGWRWSDDMGPLVGTKSCQSRHLGVSLSGRLHVETNDGVEMEVGPGEVFEIPPGHDAWVVGDESFVTVDFEAMRGFAKPGNDASRRTLATVLMTDIVGSTATAVELGHSAWAELVSRHNELSERVIGRHDGRLLKTTGDGIIGLFDSAERAVRAATEIGEAMQPLALSIRAAVQTGEVELSGGDVRGVVVHATSRMMALAGPGEVIVSTTVRDLLDGAGFEFEDAGTHELRGLPGQRQLFRLAK
jgi:class 3 adenylate cyclase